MDSNDAYAYGWSKKGAPCFAVKPGCGKKRLSVISGLHDGKLAAPCIFEGHTDADQFNAWLETQLLPAIGEGKTVVMDNARFHKSPETKELIEKAGCKLLFLSPYSPDFNPIEQRWFPLKNAARKIMRTFLCLSSALQAAILINCR